MSEDDIIQFSKDQRYPEEDEPICVVGRNQEAEQLIYRYVVDMVNIFAIKRTKMSVPSNAKTRQ